MVAELVGLRYYVDKRHFQDLEIIFRRNTISTLFVILRTLIYEVTGKQWRFGATSQKLDLLDIQSDVSHTGQD